MGRPVHLRTPAPTSAPGAVVEEMEIEDPMNELTTEGDANQVADTTPVERADGQGRARIVVPAVGLSRVGFDEGRLASPWAGSH